MKLPPYFGWGARFAGTPPKIRVNSYPEISLPPNGFGLHNMHGNVWEWCADFWHENYEGAPTDGSAWTTGGSSDTRVIRGGSWYDSPVYCRAASRYPSSPGYRLYLLGFRVVCSGSPGVF